MVLIEALQWLADPANWAGPTGVWARLVEHVGLTAAAVGIACALALPLALWLGHVDRGRVLVVNVANAGRAIPTYALLVLLALGPLGLGAAATITALVFFAIPPILTSAHTGVREVDPDVVEAARGMGMAGPAVLRRVELPLAAPHVLSGVRLATVQVVATATIAALVAGGGLGRIITAGFGRQDPAQLIAGALLVAGLALAVEGGFGLVAKRLRSPALR